MRPRLNTYQFTFFRKSASVDTCRLSIPTYRSLKLSDQWGSVFHFFCFLLVEYVALPEFLWCRMWLLMIRKTTTRVTLTTFLRTEENPLVFVWQNSCTSQFPKTSRTTSATIGKRRVKILNRQVAILTGFLRKGVLVSVWCRSHKNLNRQYKIKERVRQIFKVQRHMS
jgi:hypothetical protein